MNDRRELPLRILIAALVAVLLSSINASAGVRVAVIAPSAEAESVSYVDRLGAEMAKGTKLVDPDLAMTAFRATEIEHPFNMTTSEARNAGAAIGSDFIILARAASVNRYSLARKQFFESFAAIYLVSVRTGRLVGFWVVSFDNSEPRESERKLEESIPATAVTIAGRIAEVRTSENLEPKRPDVGLVPDPESPEARGYRSPLPYRRLSPAYTELANYYGIAATVDIEVETDASGKVTGTTIVRWAGYGLDESVEKAVRSMNWRPAERLGKPEPAKFVLRYNFRKVVKEEN